MTDRAWFDGIDIADVDAGAERLRTGRADAPDAWPALAVESGLVPSVAAYHERLRAASLAAFEQDIDALAGAADRELVQLVRTLDATTGAQHELTQRIADAVTEASTAEVSAADPETIADALASAGGVLDEALSGLLAAVEGLRRERDDLEEIVRAQATAVAPNLSALAGPLLAARLVATAGSLKQLARMPSSTVQVLGAEGALFAHLRGEASAPKHGLIFTHPAVRTAPGADRGSVARVLAGKLTIAARIDHYRGELEPTLEDDLATRLAAVTAGGSG